MLLTAYLRATYLRKVGASILEAGEQPRVRIASMIRYCDLGHWERVVKGGLG